MFDFVFKAFQSKLGNGSLIKYLYFEIHQDFHWELAG